MTTARCMICGRETAEGRHICLTCEGTDEMQRFQAARKILFAPRTNGGKIRAMGDGELAAFLVAVAGSAAAGFRDEGRVRRWLGEEAKHDA